MKTKHTPEPWHIGRPGCVVSESHVGLTINGATGEDAIRYYGGNLIGESISNANAARIVVCVNACAGMEDPAFEIEFLREQLRECTDALRGMIEATTLECSAANGFYDQRNKAKKVIEGLTPRP